MKNSSTVSSLRRLALAVLLPAAGHLAIGAEGTWSGAAEVAYVTDYLWRGARNAGDSIQPSLTAVYSDRLTLGVWGSYALEEGHGFLDPTGKYGETNYVGTYLFATKPLSVTVGGTIYGINDLVDPDTGDRFKYYFESLVSITLNTKFSPTLTYWREFGRFDSNYFEFSLIHSEQLNKQTRLSFRPFAGVFDPSRRFHYGGVDLTLRYEFANGFYGRGTVTLIKNDYPAPHKRERASFALAAGKTW